MVGAGVTLQEAITAADALAKEGINIRVVDPFTLKPVDKALLIKCAKATGGKLLTVEDHYPEGRRELFSCLGSNEAVWLFHMALATQVVWERLWLVL